MFLKDREKDNEKNNVRELNKITVETKWLGKK